MKRLIAVMFVLFAGTAQAVTVDTITNLNKNDIIIATAGVGEDTVVTVKESDGTVITSNSFSSPASKTLQINTAFDHRYLIEAVTSGFFSVATTVENGLINPITDFVMTITGLGDVNNSEGNGAGFGAEGLIGMVDIAPTGFGAVGTLGFNMIADQDYEIVLTGTATGGGSDYRLEVSVIPVPAAVWLFGTAILGLIGLRRKSKVALAAA